MRYRTFGPTGTQVSVIGQGTWNMEKDDRRSAVASLRRGLDLGMNHIDTAEMYGDGKVEEIVGEAIAGRRDKVFLVSKVLPQNASARARSRPASGACGICGPTGWITTSCTGRDRTPWRTLSRRSKSCGPRARSAPGA